MTPASEVSPHTVAALAIAVLAVAALRLLLPPPTHTGAGPTNVRGAPQPTDDGAPRAPAPPQATATPLQRAAAHAATTHARAFLDDHVTEQGRVVRHDEDGDTVSEGQAWALLLAVALGDEERATSIVKWTDAHLARDDGMLAWRWAEARTVDTEPASDADLAYAWGLSRGAETFGRDDWRTRSDELLAELASSSVVPTDDGPLLTAGPWARDRSPAVVNPSYLWDAPLAWAEETNGALHGSRAAAGALLRRLVHDDTPLVPDWVTVDGQGTVSAIGGPSDQGAPPRHGLDAVRTWIWLGSSCDPGLRDLAARAHRAFPDAGQPLPAVHDLSGSPTVDWSHAATLAGAAAAAQAAGATEEARERLDAASRLNRDHPTYYGSAVTALARMLLDTELITTCHG